MIFDEAALTWYEQALPIALVVLLALASLSVITAGVIVPAMIRRRVQAHRAAATVPRIAPVRVAS